MSGTSSDAFLNGQGIPVPLARIDQTLEDLWGPAAERVGGPELENPTATRVVLANLVVERLTPEAASLRPVLETVLERFPCRAIVIRGSDEPGRKVTAEVSAVCSLPATGGSPQVCSERIVLRAGPEALDLVPAAIWPLLETGLPMILWWTTDPTAHEKLYRDLAAECGRVMIDLPDPGTSAAALRMALDSAAGSYPRDAVWYGLTHWRELVAQLFDCPIHRRTLRRIDSVTVEAVSPDPTSPPRLALWMGAWLASQIGWEPEGTPELIADGDGSIFRASFRGPVGPATLEARTGPMGEGLPARPRLVGVSLGAHGEHGPESFRLRRDSPASPDIRIHAEAEDYCRLPNTVHADTLDAAERVGSALEFSRIDPPFEKAAPLLLWLLEHAQAPRP
ncbi:glucose-6-phosphate dehydrogenase assembly protein OpcA [Paludisphaera sp.]|uniref:glucose-6-phosphate dehydrogenase assembly protein OpcA n=1 Tax=Paludisphaera sp. TaxID=2017432 RepID=UPI00301C081F